MYFANMYCYGWDYTCAGITGIRGCLGVVFKGDRALYALHIPPLSDEVNSHAGKVFAQYVLGVETNSQAGELLLFVNGTNRTTVKDEAKAIKSRLKKPVTTMYRIMQNLGPNSGGKSALSATIRVEHTINNGLVKTYKHVPDDDWIEGGKREIGQFKIMDAFTGAEIPNDLVAGWHNIDNVTCQCIDI